MLAEVPTRREPFIITRDIVLNEVNSASFTEYVGESRKVSPPSSFEIPSKGIIDKITIIVQPRATLKNLAFQIMQDELVHGFVRRGLEPKRPHTWNFEKKEGGKLGIGKIHLEEDIGEVVYNHQALWKSNQYGIDEALKLLGVGKDEFDKLKITSIPVTSHIVVRVYPREIAEEVLRCQLARDRGFLSPHFDHLLNKVDMSNLEHARQVLIGATKRLPPQATAY